MSVLKIQELLFPQGEKFEQQWELFYHGSRTIYDEKQKVFYMPKYHIFNFASYLNAFSLQKWKLYTNIKTVKLHITLQGDVRVRLVGYQLEVHNPKKTVLSTFDYQLDEATELELIYPESNDEILSFEIETKATGKLFGGYFEGTFDAVDKRNVELAVATTTFRKEKFIQSNLQLLNEEILQFDEEIGEHITVHVIDNGRTLAAGKWNSNKITIHPNKNVGGSGGFARGMIEALEQSPKATHVLLMDDDVLILPESIKRMYRLLTVLKPEFQNHFISGAMLRYEEMNIQHEDVGFVHKDGSYGPQKNAYNLSMIREVLQCNQEQVRRQHMYAGWWFCCIPIEQIKENGLPLPLFIRGDDVEFSLRNQAEFITMNSICIWHLGFTYKFSASMELYQVHRNSLILQATSDVCKNIDFVTRMKKLFRARLLSLDYDGAELLLDAIDDFMKGPEFIEKDTGEQIMQEKGKKNPAMIDLEVFRDIDIDLNSIYYDIPRNFVRKWLYRITYNGHRFCPERLLKAGPGIVAYDWFYSPERNFWNKKLLAINPHLRTGYLREFSKDRYKQLMKRQKELLKRYDKTHLEIEQRYRERKQYLTSIEFWKKYLEI